MKIRISILLLAMSLSLPAIASELTTMVRSVEASTANLIVPTSENARLNFKPCSEKCSEDYVSVRLTPATSYQVNGAATDFLGFRQAYFNLARDKDHYALVRYDVKSTAAVSVHITEQPD